MKDHVSAAMIRDGRILLLYKRDVWIMPGGKIGEGESHEDCLRREVREELSGTEVEHLRPYKNFDGTTPHTAQPLRTHVYFADVIGELGRPSAEISKAEWIPYPPPADYKISDMTSKVLAELKADGHL